MVVELNNVVLDGCNYGLSMMAKSGQLTCITGGTSRQRSRYLLALMGLEQVKQGFVCIDGEPIEQANVQYLRQLMAYAPTELKAEGELVVYEPPSVQDVFSLKANREVPISNGILSEEVRRAGGAELVAVASLLNRKVLVVDTPPVASIDYLLDQARQGRVVIISSADDAVVSRAHQLLTVNYEQ